MTAGPITDEDALNACAKARIHAPSQSHDIADRLSNHAQVIRANVGALVEVSTLATIEKTRAVDDIIAALTQIDRFANELGVPTTKTTADLMTRLGAILDDFGSVRVLEALRDCADACGDVLNVNDVLAVNASKAASDALTLASVHTQCMEENGSDGIALAMAADVLSECEEPTCPA